MPEGEPVEAIGRVAWSKTVLTTSGDPEDSGVGVEFLGSSGDQLTALADYLDIAPEPAKLSKGSLGTCPALLMRPSPVRVCYRCDDDSRQLQDREPQRSLRRIPGSGASLCAARRAHPRLPSRPDHGGRWKQDGAGTTDSERAARGLPARDRDSRAGLPANHAPRSRCSRGAPRGRGGPRARRGAAADELTARSGQLSRPAELSRRRAVRATVVPGAGLEPARPRPGDFKSPASTHFATRARLHRLRRFRQAGRIAARRSPFDGKTNDGESSSSGSRVTMGGASSPRRRPLSSDPDGEC